MSEFTFIKEPDKDNTFDRTRVQFNFAALTLDEMLDVFEEFLKGSGFNFDGHVGIVEEDDV